MSDGAKRSPFSTGLRCRCPRCGRGPLFSGLLSLSLRAACPACGLDYRFIDSGDGPAVFVIFVLGLLIMGGGLLLEFKLHPPWWVHLLLWVPATLGVALGLLRPMKATLVALQYANQAEEGRLATGDAATEHDPPNGRSAETKRDA